MLHSRSTSDDERIGDLPSLDCFSSLDLKRFLLEGTPTVTDVDGWRRFAKQRPPEQPPRLSVEDFERLSVSDRRAYRKVRRFHHFQWSPIGTPELRTFSRDASRLAMDNLLAPPGARIGAILDGLGTVGKSTILMHFGRNYEAAVRQAVELGPDDELADARYVPVAYLTLPGALTPKALAAGIVRFYEGRVRSGQSEEALFAYAIKLAGACRTSLFLIDDIHFLQLRHKGAQAVNNSLKFLASSINATFVYAGIDVKRTGILDEGNSFENLQVSQTQYRFKHYPIGPFRKGEASLKSVLEEFEKRLVLVKARPNDLVALADYVHERTDGFMGSIVTLLREGATEAIETGVERITQPLLDRIRLPHGVQGRTAREPNGSSPVRKASNRRKARNVPA
jgi:hypothetical protein